MTEACKLGQRARAGARARARTRARAGARAGARARILLYEANESVAIL